MILYSFKIQQFLSEIEKNNSLSKFYNDDYNKVIYIKYIQ